MAIFQKRLEGLTNDKTYFIKVFTVNHKGRANNRADLPCISVVPKVGVPLAQFALQAVIVMPEGGKLIPFYVSKHDYESSLNGAGRVLMTRKHNYTKSTWHSSTTASNYGISRVDSWLNGDYLNLFDAKMKQLIGKTKFVSSVGSGTSSLKSTTLERAAFLLSMPELGGSYSSTGTNTSEGTKLPTADLLKIATNESGEAEAQWTRSIYRFDSQSKYAIAMTAAGVAERPTLQAQRGIRPSITLPADVLVNPTPNADGSYNLLV